MNWQLCVTDKANVSLIGGAILNGTVCTGGVMSLPPAKGAAAEEAGASLKYYHKRIQSNKWFQCEMDECDGNRHNPQPTVNRVLLFCNIIV